jgi:lipoprotein-releasing system permease protein
MKALATKKLVIFKVSRHTTAVSSTKNLSYYFLKKLILSDRSKSLVRRISILSFLAITISIAVFFIVLFVMNGMNKNIRSRILALDPNLTAYTDTAAKDFHFSDNDISKLNDEGLDQALAFDAYDLIIRTVDGQFRGTQVTGYDQVGLDFWNHKLKELKEKEKNNFVQQYELDLILNENEIAIGIDLARSLQLLEGDQVTLIPAETLLLSQMEAPTIEKVTVKRILTTDLYDLDSKLLVFNKNLSLKRFNTGLSKVSGFHIWTKSSDQISAIKTKLEKFRPDIVRVETWQDKNSDLFFALLMEKTMIGIFLGLAGLIASSSILTVLALLMTQKRHDIAIIKTLGLSSQKTLWLFTKMGLWISLSGLFLGSLIGISVSYYLQFFPVKVLPDYYYDASLPALVNLEFAGFVIAIVTLLAFLGCYLPAKATLSIHPAILLKR